MSTNAAIISNTLNTRCLGIRDTRIAHKDNNPHLHLLTNECVLLMFIVITGPLNRCVFFFTSGPYPKITRRALILTGTLKHLAPS